MVRPLALLFHSNLLLGNQLANRLQDLGYRVQVLSSLADLAQEAERDKPLVVVAEFSARTDLASAVTALKANPSTQHIPVLAYSAETRKELPETLTKAGVSMLASSAGILDQLPQLLDRILDLE